jgi:hypothetical protein
MRTCLCQLDKDSAKPRRLVPLMGVHLQPGYEWATTRWLRRQVAERRLAFCKVVGKVLVDLNDLDTFAEDGRVPAVRGPLGSQRQR